MPRVTIGSRGSDLALYQAKLVQSHLADLGCETEIKIIKTAGDKETQLSFDKMEGKGFFTKEIEEALLSKEIDLAVHSLKDLMTTQPVGLKLGAVGFRANPREMFLIRPEAHEPGRLLPVKDGSTIGTSSNRRQAQIKDHNSELTIRDLRGNVPTRVGKLCDGLYDGIVIAAAGIERLELDLAGLKAIVLPRRKFLPAPGQGILGLQIRSDDDALSKILLPLHSKQNETEAALERGLLARFDSGCSLPLGAISSVDGEQLRLTAVLGVKHDEQWSGLRHCDVHGTNIDDLVSQAFSLLTSVSA